MVHRVSEKSVDHFLVSPNYPSFFIISLSLSLCLQVFIQSLLRAMYSVKLTQTTAYLGSLPQTIQLKASSVTRMGNF